MKTDKTMERSTNALAELALNVNLLKLDRTAYSSYEDFIKACETKNKAVLFLNELSKVKIEYSISKDGNGIHCYSISYNAAEN